MKNIQFLILIAVLSITSFTACENDEIGVNEILSHREQYYPEAITSWGGGIDEVKTEMNKYNLNYNDIFQMDAEYTDGRSEVKWFLYYFGKNPYDIEKEIIYLYCFDTATTGLKAVQIILHGIDMSDITSQLKAHGYDYGDYNSQNYYHTFQSNSTIVRVYVPTQSSKYHSLVYQKRGDSDELMPKVLN